MWYCEEEEVGEYERLVVIYGKVREGREMGRVGGLLYGNVTLPARADEDHKGSGTESVVMKEAIKGNDSFRIR